VLQGTKVLESSHLRKILIPIVVFLFVLSLISASFHTNERLNFFEALLVEVTGPVQKAVRITLGGIGNLWRGYFNLVGVQRENRALRGELQELKRKLNRYREAYLANQRLRALLNFKKSIGSALLPAEVVAFDPSGWFHTVLIDKGSTDELVRDMAVVNAQGLVGRVIGVSGHYAKVLLILDANSAVDALVQRSRARGILVGRGSGRCLLKYVRRNEDVREGDQVISSGMGGVFPKALLLGRVKAVDRSNSGLFQTVEVEPAVDFSRLEEVMVVMTPPSKDPVSGRGSAGKQ
jgi:rod shape-determining protein MreC